jgi:hypothetical protein
MLLRYAIPAIALSGFLAYQQPGWVRAIEAGVRDFGTQAGIGSLFRDHATIAARAAPSPPDRTAAMSALDRAAAQSQDAAASRDPTARDRVMDLVRSAAVTMAGSEALGELRAMQDARARLADLREQAAQQHLSGGDTAELDAQVASAAAKTSALTDVFVDKLSAIGVQITHEAAENLAVSVNGDDVVALIGAYANVGALEAGLREAVTRSQDNEAVVRRYYGVHATLLAVLETIQAEAVSRIDNVYLPRLDGVARETGELHREAQVTLQQARDPALKASLEANMRTQDLTSQAADLYRRYLQEQRSGLAQVLERTRIARGVAENTARTAVLALDVAAMVRNTDRDFSAVMSLRPPVIVPFEGEALRHEFEGLSRRLGQQPTS